MEEPPINGGGLENIYNPPNNILVTYREPGAVERLTTLNAGR